MTQPLEKLNSFVSAMLTEAQSEADEILRKAEAEEKTALDEYEAALAAKSAEQKTARAAAAALQSAKRLASARLKCRRELLEERERCAALVYDAVRARLETYPAAPGYGEALVKLARAGAESIPGSGPLTVSLRAQDLQYAPMVTAALGGETAVLTGTFRLGGVILARPDAHRRADLSYDSALADLQGRFSDITGFDVEARHGN